MELTYLHNILLDLKVRFNSKCSPDSFHLKRELILLNRNEKLLIRKKVLKFDYNVGTLKVLRALKEAGILSLTEYLTNITNEGEVQGIIGDVIDCEDLEMIVELFMSSKTSELIELQLQECLRQYISDVVSRSELIKKDFISSIEKQLPLEVFRDSILLQFINELLSQELHKTSDIKQVFSCQKDWNSQFSNEKFKLLSSVLRQVSLNHSETIAKLLLSKLHSDIELNWFFILLILKQLDQKSKSFDGLKKFIKTLFQKFQETDSIDNLLEMMILARQLFHYHPESEPGDYKAWVKTTIGEMHYHLKSHPAFVKTLEALQSMVSFETDLEVLDIHVQTVITSPRGKNHLVLEYKQLLRAHIASLATCFNGADLEL